MRDPTSPDHFHEEQSFRQWWLWLLIAVAALPALVILTGGGGVALVVLPVVVLAAIVSLFAFARLVVDVDRDAITVAFHVLWPTRRIRVADVRRAHAIRYRPLIDYGGYGVRIGMKGMAYNVSGTEGVLVETADGSRVMIGSQRAKELEAAIARAVRERQGV